MPFAGYRGSEWDLVCNEGGLFFKTVLLAEVTRRLTELAPVVEDCELTDPVPVGCEISVVVENEGAVHGTP